MPLERGEVHGYDFNRMVVEFTMIAQGRVIPCAISTAAMDDLENGRSLKPEQRVEQFMRLRESSNGKHHANSPMRRPTVIDQ